MSMGAMFRSIASLVLVVCSLHTADAARSSSRTREVMPVAAGTYHACAVLRDGGVSCWGNGYLGNGDASQSTGVIVSGLTDVIGLAAGANSTCALRADGTVRCWGTNAQGQLGDGTTTVRFTPVTVVGLDTVVALTQTQLSYCARLANGQVKCWGNNYSGQIGDNTLVNRPLPTTVAGLTKVVSLAGGRDHVCASTAAGLVYCWGDNKNLQTAQPLSAPIKTATLVPNLSNIKQVGLGSRSSCALAGTGQVQCWGSNDYGALGRGFMAPYPENYQTPAPVVSLTNVVRLTHGGALTMCAIRSTGELMCWGANTYGQLGIGSTIDSYRATPTRASTLGDNAVFVATSAHSDNAFGYTCALRGTGVVLCAGFNANGQLADGTTTDRSSFVSTTVNAMPWNGQDLTTGEGTTCAGKDNGSARCWGTNTTGQLGVGDELERTTPAAIVGLFTSAGAVTSGSGHSCVLMTDGTAACMGGNQFGQLGDGTTASHSRATDVTGLVTTKDVTSISASHEHHTCVALADGHAKCWGLNAGGQIGDGSAVNRLVPTFVYNMNNVVQVTTGAGHSCALLVDGSIKCWGDNDVGQLGDGTTTRRYLPVVVVGLATNAVAIAAGRYHTCAQLVDDTVQCWGANYYGQLGEPSTVGGSSVSPVTVRVAAGVLHGVVALTSGNDHSCVVVAGGGLSCWGDNYYYQLGDGTQTQRNVATPIAGLTLLSRVSAGWSHGCARRANGTVACWGMNTYGELGDGTYTARSTPTFLSTTLFP